MSQGPTLRQSFDRQAFEQGLRGLSSGIARSQVLAPFRPLELGKFIKVLIICVGIYGIDKLLKIWTTSEVLGAQYKTVREEMKRLIEEVANSLRYDSKWANDDVRVFLSLLNDPNSLFRRSKAQNVVLFRDGNLIVYAVLWEWVVIRKLKRLQMEGQVPRREDWSDCVAICKLLYDRNGSALHISMFRQFDDTDREPPVETQTLANLRRLVVHLTGVEPFNDPPSLPGTVAAPSNPASGRQDQVSSGQVQPSIVLETRVQQARTRRDELCAAGVPIVQAIRSLVMPLAQSAGITPEQAATLLSRNQ